MDDGNPNSGNHNYHGSIDSGAEIYDSQEREGKRKKSGERERYLFFFFQRRQVTRIGTADANAVFRTGVSIIEEDR